MASIAHSEVLFVVADRFENFAANPSVITLGGLRESVSSGTIGEGSPAVLRPGMGIDDEDWTKLRAFLDEYGAGEAVALADPPVTRLPGPSALKSAQVNVLLGTPA